MVVYECRGFIYVDFTFTKCDSNKLFVLILIFISLASIGGQNGLEDEYDTRFIISKLPL